MRFEFNVYGMSCGKCVTKLSEALRAVPDVVDVEISLEDRSAKIDVADLSPVDQKILEQVVLDTGFSLDAPTLEPLLEDVSSSSTAQDETARYEIRGMSCANCAATLEKGVKSLEGVSQALVNLALERMQVTYTRGAQDEASIREKVHSLGFEAVPEEAFGRLVLHVDGMHCASCVQTVEKILMQIPGVSSAVVNLADNRATISYDPTSATRDVIKKALQDAGYTAREHASNSDDLEKARHELGWVVLSAALTLPILPLMWFAPFGDNTVWVIALLASIMQFSAGIIFYQGAWRSLRNHAANMDVLVALGISAAYGYSLVALIPKLGLGDTVFFETGAMLILFIRFGKWLEARARGKASQALRGLLQLQPERATLISDSGEESVALEQVKVGDTLLVRAGEKIPADGEVLEGHAAIDESMVTGEPLPVERGPGGKVTGATINRNGRIVMRAEHVGSDTLLAHIVKLVADAQSDKAPIQRMADRVSGVFVPVVVAVSLITFATWLFLGYPFLFAFQMAIAVLVIACPCALGLATPTAIMVGSGVGLRAGLLFKRASTLEQSSHLDMVVFDKTGTLTEGQFKVVDVLPNDMTETELLQLAASAESASNHPLAQAVVSHAREHGVVPEEPQQSEELGGLGLRCVVGGKTLLAGNEGLLKENRVDVADFLPRLETIERDGDSLVLFAVDGKVSGAITFSDTLKADAAKTVKSLRAIGVRSAMLTGDRAVSARAVARQLAIDEVHAEVLPGQKQEVIKDLQTRGLRVAMVGDGINDAPALAQADVGVAIGSGTDVAKEAGELVLVRGMLYDVYRAIMLGRKTMRKIRQNLFWAFFYNVVGIPLAAGVLYPLWGLTLKPEFAGLAMAFSSVSVVTNSLLLRRYQLPE